MSYDEATIYNANCLIILGLLAIEKLVTSHKVASFTLMHSKWLQNSNKKHFFESFLSPKPPLLESNTNSMLCFRPCISWTIKNFSITCVNFLKRMEISYNTHYANHCKLAPHRILFLKFSPPNTALTMKIFIQFYSS